jgi:sugar phosphate isomerase/epimerase
MKFSIFTVMLPEWDAATAVKKMKCYGYDGVEWRVTNSRPEFKNDPPSFWRHNLCTVELDTIVEKAKSIRKLCDDAGLETAALAGYNTCQDVEATEKMLAAAKTLGAPVIRVGISGYDGTRPFEELFKESRAGYEKMARMAAKAKVRICIETHPGLITSSASGLRRLLDGLDPQAVGAIYDPGNLVNEGYEETKMGLEILGPYLAHVHCKNTAWIKKPEAQPGEYAWQHVSTRMDEGIVDWRKVLKLLGETGYDGYVSFEDFSTSASTEEKVKFNIGYIKSLL